MPLAKHPMSCYTPFTERQAHRLDSTTELKMGHFGTSQCSPFCNKNATSDLIEKTKIVGSSLPAVLTTNGTRIKGPASQLDGCCAKQSLTVCD